MPDETEETRQKREAAEWFSEEIKRNEARLTGAEAELAAKFKTSEMPRLAGEVQRIERLLKWLGDELLKVS